MARFHLVQQTPGSASVRVELDGEVQIGRESDCRVILQDDLVSRHHARVLLENGRVRLKDLGSTNGTTVGGAKVTETWLKTGQSFTVGRSTFLVKEDDGEEARARRTDEALSKTASFVLTDTEAANVYETRSSAGIQPGKATGATAPLTLEQMSAMSQRLAALNRIGGALASILDVDSLLEEVVDQVFLLFARADRCCILMETDGQLKPSKVKARGRMKDAGDIRLSRTVVSLNRDERKAVLSFDTSTDQRLSAAMSIVASGIRSIMSVPIVAKDEFFGILYLDTADIGAPFSADDLEMLASLASQVAIFVKNARLVSQMEKETELRTNLGRYLSPSVVAEIAEGRLNPSLGGETREGTVLFSDIVGFTKVCRNLSAADVVSLLNKFFRDLVDAVFVFKGTVDKFGGDAMLCVWGAPVPMQDHAGPAIGAALEMQNRLYGFNLMLEATGAPVRIRMGIGLNSGSFIAGNVGSEERLEYTVIGDAVNLAQRVEEKASGGMVLVSDATRRLAPNASAVRMKPTVIRGATGDFLVHSVRAVPRVGSPKALLVSIPARVGKAGSGSRIEGVLVGFESGAMGPVLSVRVPEASGLVGAGALEIEPLLPECPGVPVLAGGILQSRPREEGRPWIDVDLLVQALPAPLDAILRPASAWESPLRPEDIPRS